MLQRNTSSVQFLGLRRRAVQKHMASQANFQEFSALGERAFIICAARQTLLQLCFVNPYSHAYLHNSLCTPAQLAMYKLFASILQSLTPSVDFQTSSLPETSLLAYLWANKCKILPIRTKIPTKGKFSPKKTAISKEEQIQSNPSLN